MDTQYTLSELELEAKYVTKNLWSQYNLDSPK
jgi:hypothetical protein